LVWRRDFDFGVIAIMSETRDGPSDSTIAVALGRDKHRRGVARVKATGRGLVAEQILAIAFERGVKVREDANLANVLAAVELDSPIPVGVLATVAEILSYVYRANNEASPVADPQSLTESLS
jgi:flagellar biosynthesis protein